METLHILTKFTQQIQNSKAGRADPMGYGFITILYIYVSLDSKLSENC